MVITSEVLQKISLREMVFDDLLSVIDIETQLMETPWSLTHFHSCLRSGYECWVLVDATSKASTISADQIVAYAIVAVMVDEAHLLTIGVAPTHQCLGLGGYFLGELQERSKVLNAQYMLLEVRESNQQAQNFYSRYAFTEIGRRKGYYAKCGGGRETAIVMRTVLV